MEQYPSNINMELLYHSQPSQPVLSQVILSSAIFVRSLLDLYCASLNVSKIKPCNSDKNVSINHFNFFNCKKHNVMRFAGDLNAVVNNQGCCCCWVLQSRFVVADYLINTFSMNITIAPFQICIVPISIFTV